MIELIGLLMPWIIGWFLKMVAILFAAPIKFLAGWLILSKPTSLWEIISETGSRCREVTKAELWDLWKTLKADPSSKAEARKDRRCR